jgi:hypothetical protein
MTAYILDAFPGLTPVLTRRRRPLLRPPDLSSLLVRFLVHIRSLHNTNAVLACNIGNFKSVKRGKFDDYSIRKYQSNVVADDFKFGTDKNVVVALEQDVFMVNKKQLQKVCHVSTGLCIYANISSAISLPESRCLLQSSSYVRVHRL